MNAASPVLAALVAVMALSAAMPTSVGGERATPLAAPGADAAAGPPGGASSTARPPTGLPPLPSGLNSSLRNVLVTAPCNDGPARQPVQARDPGTGDLYEVFIGCGGIGFARSLDGGWSFQPAFQLPGSGPHRITYPNGTPPGAVPTSVGELRPITTDDNASAWDPQIAVAPNGTVYVAYMDGYLDGYLPGAYPVVAWSDNDGASFQGYSNVTLWYNGTYNDRDTLAVAPNGTVYVGWQYSPIDPVTCPRGSSGGCFNGTTPDRTWCTVTTGCAFVAGDYQFVVARSSDGARTWSAWDNVTPLRPTEQAITGELAVSPNGTLDALVQQAPSSGGPVQVLGNATEWFTRSFDGGAAWTAPIELSGLNYTPAATWWVDGALTVDPGGVLYAAFDSYHVEPTTDDAWLFASTDGGAAWDAPLDLDANDTVGVSMDVAIGTAGGGGAYVAWAANNTTGRTYAVYGAPVERNGTLEGPIALLSDQTGEFNLPIGDTYAVTALGGPAYAVAFALGVYQPVFGTSTPQVFAAFPGLALPPAPSRTSFLPGKGSALVSWTEPPTNATITGFYVRWSIEAQLEGNETLGPTVSMADIGPLTAFATYGATVAAVNGAGAGPVGPALNITLTAWTVYRGSIAPPQARVSLDGTPLPVTGGAFSANRSYGAHGITAVAASYAPLALALPSAWNATVWQNLTLSLLGSEVRGTIFPVTSSATWDGVALLLVNGVFSLSAPAESNHTLNVTFPGFLSTSRTVFVPANSTIWVNVSLVPRPGMIGLLIVPVSAVVVVNGSIVPLNSTGAALVILPAGSYTVSASAPGYENWSGTEVVLPDQWTNVTESLEKISAPPGSGGGGGTLPLLASPLFLGAVALLTAAIVVVLLLGVRNRRIEARRPRVVVPRDEAEVDRVRQLRARTPDSVDDDGPPTPP